MPESPLDSDPFAGLGVDPESRKPLPPSRRKLVQRIMAGVIFFLGMLEIGIAVVLSLNYEWEKWQMRLAVFVGIGICASGCAIYDGRLFGLKNRRR